MNHLLLFLSVLLSLFLATYSFRRVAYYPSWAQYGSASCQFMPESVNATLYTHLIYAFAYVNGTTFNLYPSEFNDQSSMYRRVEALKSKNPSLKILLSVTTPEGSKGIFSNVVSTQANRQLFVKNSLKYIKKWKFDGIDIDWEFPAQSLTGGVPADRENFSLLLQEFRTQITTSYSGKYLLTIATAPEQELWTSAYDLPTIQQYVDWINLMTYEFHGYWDRVTDPQTPMNSTTDQYYVKYAVQGYLSAGVPSSKICVGLALNGQTYTIGATSTCPGYLTRSFGGGPKGTCTQSVGVLSYAEIVNSVLNQPSTTRIFDPVSQTPYACYTGSSSGSFNYWVSYDDVTSLKYKTDYIKSMNLGGAMFWALGQDLHDQLTGSVYSELY